MSSLIIILIDSDLVFCCGFAAKAEKPAPLAGLPEAHEQLNTSAFLNKGGSHLCVLSTQTAFAMFVRPQHKERFLGMLTDLAGGGTAEDPHAHLETPGSNATPARGQSKISAFFSSSQRK
ncbi:hypothetical protein SKAU_G00096730 [Synaphobranchus kaupii]|uniref:Uncharacterized protein n=1 Tax=Synaphobranchus kaupii TaxID=118154 RepID=A0A9Q1J4W1_SYNKA|nr:hypothetical protein SKAU_G00096730 [Synaphobranchus kaupii]